MNRNDLEDKEIIDYLLTLCNLICLTTVRCEDAFRVLTLIDSSGTRSNSSTKTIEDVMFNYIYNAKEIDGELILLQEIKEKEKFPFAIMNYN